MNIAERQYRRKLNIISDYYYYYYNTRDPSVSIAVVKLPTQRAVR